MRLLFIKPKHIGDALLLTPTLDAVREHYPHADIWVLVRKGSEGILSGCNAIDRLITTSPPEKDRRRHFDWWYDFRTIMLLRKQKFDFAFELGDGDRGRFIAWLSNAKVRCANTIWTSFNGWWPSKFNCLSHYDWRCQHRVEKDFYTVNDALPLGSIVPRLRFTSPTHSNLSILGNEESYAILHPATRWDQKKWPIIHWVTLGRELLKRFNKLVVSVGPVQDEIDCGEAICRQLGSKAINTRGQLSWTQLSSLFRDRLFVGVDTAAMHLASASNSMVVALFGPSIVHQWKPWNPNSRVVTPPGSPTNPESVIAGSPLPTNLENVSPADVLAACDALYLENGMSLSIK